MRWLRRIAYRLGRWLLLFGTAEDSGKILLVYSQMGKWLREHPPTPEQLAAAAVVTHSTGDVRSDVIDAQTLRNFAKVLAGHGYTPLQMLSIAVGHAVGHAVDKPGGDKPADITAVTSREWPATQGGGRDGDKSPSAADGATT